MIEYTQAEGFMCPVIYCDLCNEIITESGNVYWMTYDSGTTYPYPWFCHKQCAHLDRLLEERYNGSVSFEELSRFLDQLTHNFKSTHFNAGR